MSKMSPFVNSRRHMPVCIPSRIFRKKPMKDVNCPDNLKYDTNDRTWIV